MKKHEFLKLWPGADLESAPIRVPLSAFPRGEADQESLENLVRGVFDFFGTTRDPDEESLVGMCRIAATEEASGAFKVMLVRTAHYRTGELILTVVSAYPFDDEVVVEYGGVVSIPNVPLVRQVFSVFQQPPQERADAPK